MPRTATVVAEIPLLLHVNGAPWAAWSASPEQLDELCAGRLVTDGLVRAREDLLELLVSDVPAPLPGAGAAPPDAATRPGLAPVTVEATVTEEALARGRAEREGRTAAGLAWYLDAGRLRRPAAALPLPSPEEARELFRALYADTDTRHPGGGVHSAALSDGARLLHQVEDVGRHNALDRLAGHILLHGLNAPRLGIVISARLSGDAAVKAARAGVAWVASRSAATTLAEALAAAAGLPLLVRAANANAAEVVGGEAR